VGLNYGADHLRQDAFKLHNSKIDHGYLVHLVRGSSQEEQIRKFLNSESPGYPGVRLVFAQVKGPARHVKFLEDKVVRRA
jgi:hypothetical protein